jgi:hypothetical protein
MSTQDILITAEERLFAKVHNLRLEPSAEIEPRELGGRYWSGYWGRTYMVEQMKLDECGRLRTMTVLWDVEGRRTTHCTAWDPRYDRIVREAP